MEGQKFVLKSKTVLGALVSIFAAVYLLFVGSPPSPEVTTAVTNLADKAADQIASIVALVGSAVALYGRLVAKTQIAVVPK